MYIRNYQIHNVLNVYRKQLSHGPGGNGSKNLSGTNAKDRISISADGQRQSIMDKISTEIVERISQAGPQHKFENVLADQLSKKPEQQAQIPTDNQQDFKYTVLDENNRKKTNTLTIQGFSPTSTGMTSKAGHHIGKNPIPDLE
jgi:hypothetical protein